MFKDPFTLWLQSTVIWVKLYQTQQENYLQMMCMMAKHVPHGTSRDLAKDAESFKTVLKSDTPSKSTASKQEKNPTPDEKRLEAVPV